MWRQKAERWRERASSATASREPAAHETRGQCGTPGVTQRSSSETARGPQVVEVGEAAGLGEAAVQKSSSQAAARSPARSGSEADGVDHEVELEAEGRVQDGAAPHMMGRRGTEGDNHSGFEGSWFPVRLARTFS